MYVLCVFIWDFPRQSPFWRNLTNQSARSAKNMKKENLMKSPRGNDILYKSLTFELNCELPIPLSCSNCMIHRMGGPLNAMHVLINCNSYHIFLSIFIMVFSNIILVYIIEHWLIILLRMTTERTMSQVGMACCLKSFWWQKVFQLAILTL